MPFYKIVVYLLRHLSLYFLESLFFCLKFQVPQLSVHLQMCIEKRSPEPFLPQCITITVYSPQK